MEGHPMDTIRNEWMSNHEPYTEGSTMRLIWQRRCAIVTLAALFSQAMIAPFAIANPAAPSVVGGQAQVAGLGTNHVTITQATQRAIINWQSFNIAPNEVTQFVQPNAHAVALNRIFDQNPSQIFGQLQANGTVMLLNRNGIIFGPNAQVNVGGLVASSLNLSNVNFMAGYYLFQGTGVEGLVKNSGAIHAFHDGAYLLAPNVENSGIIVSPGGNVVLGAGSTAYLSNRPDGRGFLAEVTAPAGTAANLKDILADGGQVTLAGRVVNQAGLIRADSVREQQGKIEILARDAVTLAEGSRTLARGGDDGVSQGGTVRAVANLQNGTATFEQGAVVDVSGGKNGGNGGFAEISAASVNLRGQFYGGASQGYTGGRFLIDPSCVAGSSCSVDAAEIDSFANSGANLVEFKSADGFGLTVTGQYNLAAGAWQLPAGQRGTIKFTATTGDLLFQNFELRNAGSGVAWDYVGTAQNNVRFNQSFLETGFGGNMAFTATNGSISLMQSTNVGGNLVTQGAVSTIRTPEAGGNITLTAGQDVISPNVFVTDLRLDPLRSARFAGIRLDGTGDLHITAGRNFIGGGLINGRLFGPGFVLTNGKADVTAQQIGGPLLATSSTTNDQYAQITLASGEVTLTATHGNVYLGRIQDKGLSDFDSNSTKTISVDPNNKVTVNVNDSDLYLNPLQLSRTGTPILGTNVYPASFNANVPKGNINIQANVNFWGSPTGTVTFKAGQNIQGNALGTAPISTDVYQYIYVGSVTLGGTWVLVNVAEAAKSPVLSTFLYTKNGEQSPPHPPNTAVPPRPNDVNPSAMPDNAEYVFVGDVGRGGQWVVVNKVEAQLNPILSPYLSSPLPQGAPARPVPVGTPITFPVGPAPLATRTISLLQSDPKDLKGIRPDNLTFTRMLQPNNFTTNPIAVHAPAEVTFKAGLAGIAGQGNIRGLVLNLGSVPFKKKVTISAADNLETVSAIIAAPAGVESLVQVGKSIDFASTSGQIAFVGTGTGRV